MKLYSVVYRTGGTVNFHWQASLATLDVQEAVALLEQVWRGGRVAYLSVTDGGPAPLPTTFGGGIVDGVTDAQVAA